MIIKKTLRPEAPTLLWRSRLTLFNTAPSARFFY